MSLVKACKKDDRRLYCRLNGKKAQRGVDMTKKDEWIEVGEAASILSRKSGRPIKSNYVRQLAHKGHFRFKPKDGRTNLYYRADIEAYHPIRVRRRAAS